MINNIKNTAQFEAVDTKKNPIVAVVRSEAIWEMAEKINELVNEVNRLSKIVEPVVHLGDPKRGEPPIAIIRCEKNPPHILTIDKALNIKSYGWVIVRTGDGSAITCGDDSTTIAATMRLYGFSSVMFTDGRIFDNTDRLIGWRNQ